MEIETSLQRNTHLKSTSTETDTLVQSNAATSSPLAAHLSSESEWLAKRASELVFTKKGYDVVIMDLRKVADMTDFFVICTADSDIQVKAITDAIVDGLREEGEKPYHLEGTQELSWVLIDYVDVVVHVFLKETRSFYNIEKLWGDAEFQHVKDPTLAAEK